MIVREQRDKTPHTSGSAGKKPAFGISSHDIEKDEKNE